MPNGLLSPTLPQAAVRTRMWYIRKLPLSRPQGQLRCHPLRPFPAALPNMGCLSLHPLDLVFIRLPFCAPLCVSVCSATLLIRPRPLAATLRRVLDEEGRWTNACTHVVPLFCHWLSPVFPADWMFLGREKSKGNGSPEEMSQGYYPKPSGPLMSENPRPDAQSNTPIGTDTDYPAF